MTKLKDAEGTASFKQVVADAKKAKHDMEKAQRLAKIAGRIAFRKVIYDYLAKKSKKAIAKKNTKNAKSGKSCKKPLLAHPIELVFPYSSIPSIRKAQLLMNKKWCDTFNKAWSLN